jgi:hypothetical protein
MAQRGKFYQVLQALSIALFDLFGNLDQFLMLSHRECVCLPLRNQGIQALLRG